MSVWQMTRGRRRRGRQAAVIASAIAAGLAGSGSVYAGDAIWTNAAGDGRYGNAANWDTLVAPDNTTTVHFTQVGISADGRTPDLVGSSSAAAVIFNHTNDTY